MKLLIILERKVGMRIKGIVGIFLAAMTMLTACGKSATQLRTKYINESDKSIKSVEAVIPSPISKGTDVNKFENGDAHSEWWEDYVEKVHNSQTVQEGMGQYYEQIQKELLSDASDHNAVCSPLNIYIALSMLAEVTDGNTRKQILDVLNVKDMDVLNKRIEAIWDANYVDTPALKSILANSIWLRNDIGYNEDTLKRLSVEYHASSYSGEMGSESMNQKLQKWTDEHTGELLTEYTKELKLKQESVLALISTVYYKASWDKDFPKEQTNKEIFHGASGDQSVPMMHNDVMTDLYQTEHFQAVGLSLVDSGTMYFFLPKEGYKAQDIATDPQMIKICMEPVSMESNSALVHLTVPKFNDSAKTDLLECLKDIGITDVLSDKQADFTPLTKEIENIYLSSAEHAAMVKIDEEGVIGAAYTVLMMEAAGIIQDQVDFIIDRPFVYAVAAPDGSILFTGVIQNIE